MLDRYHRRLSDEFCDWGGCEEALWQALRMAVVVGLMAGVVAVVGGRAGTSVAAGDPVIAAAGEIACDPAERETGEHRKVRVPATPEVTTEF